MTQNILDQVEQNTGWKQYHDKDRIFHADQVLHAYEEGKKDGTKNIIDKSIRDLNKNLSFVSDDVLSLRQKFNELEFAMNNAYLRINTPNDFDVKITVPTEQYLNDNFLLIYKRANEISIARSFSLNFSFIASDDDENDLNSDELSINGFQFIKNDER